MLLKWIFFCSFATTRNRVANDICVPRNILRDTPVEQSRGSNDLVQYVFPVKLLVNSGEVISMTHVLQVLFLSVYVIYGIECTLCGLLYVGETRQTLRSRMNQHRYDARDPKYRICIIISINRSREGQTIWCSKFFQLNYL
jgi:hypothetical protein